MIAAEEDVLLQLSVLNLFKVKENILAYGLDCPLLSRVVTVQFSEENLTEGALSQQSLFLEVLISHICLSAACYHLRLARDPLRRRIWLFFFTIVTKEHAVVCDLCRSLLASRLLFALFALFGG